VLAHAVGAQAPMLSQPSSLSCFAGGAVLPSFWHLGRRLHVVVVPPCAGTPAGGFAWARLRRCTMSAREMPRLCRHQGTGSVRRGNHALASSHPPKGWAVGVRALYQPQAGPCASLWPLLAGFRPCCASGWGTSGELGLVGGGAGGENKRLHVDQVARAEVADLVEPEVAQMDELLVGGRIELGIVHQVEA
jgi:hypothetical protein